MPAAGSREQVVGLLRTPRTGRVRVHRAGRLQQRRHHPPGLLDRVLAGERRAVSVHRGLQQNLVRRRPLAALVGELHVERDRLRATLVGAVGVDLEPDAGPRVELDDQLALLGRPALVGHEAKSRRAVEHEPELGLRHRQPLAGPDEERDARPSPVVDLEPERGIGLGRRARRDAVDAEIAVVLPAHVVMRVGVGHRAEDGEFRVLQRVGVRARRRLHRRHRDDLHQVVDDDVLERADAVVEMAAVLDAEVLGHRDLDARDVMAVPDRLEHRVGEAQVEDLLKTHLPEVVVDPVELGLVDVLVDVGGELVGGREVVTERLLDDDAGVLGQVRVVQALDHGAEQERRDLEIEDGLLRAPERRRDALVGCGVAKVALHVGEPSGESCRTPPHRASPRCR